jgi:autotransporter-associated beta strand protein
VTGTLTHSLGDITLNSSGAGGSAWIDAYAVVNLGGAWTFGGNDGTQVLTVGAGGLTIGNGSMIDINAGATASNAVSLAGNVTSLAASAPNMITGKGEVKLNAERTVDVADGVAIVDLLLGAKITDGAGAGSLTKLGAGTLSLTNANTYTGGTAVNAGTLAIYSTLSLPGWNSGGAYTIASNATLAVGNGVADGAITTILGTGNFAAGGRLGFDTTLGDRTNSLALNDPSGVMLGLTKAGNNTLTLSGANGYTGHTAINEGTLAITGTGALPGWDTAGRYTVASGAMLLVPNAVTEANVVTMLATGNFANGAILGFDTTAGNRNHTAAIANSAGGVLNVYKTGINQLQLSGDSSYDGVTTIQKGVLRITHANALGSTNGATTIYSTGSNLTGGQLLVAGGLVVAEPISVIGPGDSGPLYHLAVQVPGAGGSNTLTGPVTINTPGAVRMGAGGTDSVLVFKGPFMRATAANALQVTVGADNGRVIFDTWIDNKGGDLALPGGGRGVVQFNVASNNIGNVQIAGKHELRLGASDALAVNRQVQIGYESPWADASIGTLNLAGYNQTINQLYGGGSSNAVTARVVTNSAPSLSTLTVGNGNGSGTFDGVIGGHLALTKVGTGTQTLGGPGTFTGDTTVQAGMLRITNALALQQSTLVTSTGAFSVASLTDCTLGGLSGSYALGLTNATGAALTLNVGNNNSDTTFSGALSGSGSLKKIGNGKLTLAGVNTYTGATTVEAGTLALGCDNALSTGTQITLNGGTLAPGSFANSLSALMVGASNGTIDVGDGSGALAFAGSSGQTWNGTLNITFTGEWNPYALKFGTSPAGLSAAQLSSLRVNGQKTWLILDAQGYLVRLTGTLIRVM